MADILKMEKKPEPREIDYDVLGCEECDQFLFLLAWEDDKVIRIECATCGKPIAIDEVNGLLNVPIEEEE